MLAWNSTDHAFKCLGGLVSMAAQGRRDGFEQRSSLQRLWRQEHASASRVNPCVDARIESPPQPTAASLINSRSSLAFNSPWRQSGDFCSRYLYPRRSSAHLIHLPPPRTTTPQCTSLPQHQQQDEERAAASCHGGEDSPCELRARRAGRTGLRRRRPCQDHPHGEDQPR